MLLIIFCMLVLRIFITASTTLFTIRTIFLMCRKNSEAKIIVWDILFTSCLDICGFFATKAAIFAAFFVTIVVLTAQMLLRERKKRSGDEIEIFVDHLIMSMRAGISFEMALRESVQGHPHRLILFNNHHTYGQLLAHCRDNPSQSYKLLEVFRQTTRLRNKLHAKHRTLSLQAKAQGLIGVALFIVIFVFQWLMIPDFRNFLRASSGRFVVILCAFLIFLGTRWIFKIGKPPEFQL